jgi:hypothetical protein
MAGESGVRRWVTRILVDSACAQMQPGVYLQNSYTALSPGLKRGSDIVGRNQRMTLRSRIARHPPAAFRHGALQPRRPDCTAVFLQGRPVRISSFSSCERWCYRNRPKARPTPMPTLAQEGGTSRRRTSGLSAAGGVRMKGSRPPECPSTGPDCDGNRGRDPGFYAPQRPAILIAPLHLP